jgi:phospholipase/carboxylesterase
VHRNPPVIYETGPDPALTAVLVHGRTLTPDYMRALADRIALPAIRYVLPAADGNTWYPKSFLAPLAENEPHLSAAIAHYESIVASLLAEGVPASRLVVGGFSQGACLTAEYLARHPRRFAGAILWTGGLIGPEGTRWPTRAAFDGMPVYVTTATTDPFVPPARVRETADWFLASGATVTARIFEGRDHVVSDLEIAEATRLLTAALR